MSRWLPLVLALIGAWALVALVWVTVSYGKEKPMMVPLVRGDIDVLARTLYGEARGEELKGMQAVAWVVVNRVRKGPPRFKSSILGVVTAPHQFSCWSKADPNSKLCATVTESDPLFALATFAAAGVLSGEVRDPTGGADHYHADYMRPFPEWTKKMTKTAVIGNHIFYRDG
jgi:N-acetylmuramoyl-L-alanine amidase